MTQNDLEDILRLANAASPAPVALMRIPEGYPPIDWIAECLNRSVRQDVWGVVLDTPTAAEEGMPTAITGNGPTSLANAEFYVMCHTAIPALVHECTRLRAVADSVENIITSARSIVKHWGEFGPEYGLDEWMDGLDRLIRTMDSACAAQRATDDPPPHEGDTP